MLGGYTSLLHRCCEAAGLRQGIGARSVAIPHFATATRCAALSEMGNAMINRIRKAVIPLSSFANGFLPATKAMPREMMPIVDKPLIQYAVEEAADAGITDIIFVTGRGKRIVEDHFDKAYELEEELAAHGKDKVLSDLQRQLPANMHFASMHLRGEYGYGDALLTARAFIGDEPFAVILPEHLIDADPSAMRQITGQFQTTGRSIVGIQSCQLETVPQPEKISAALLAEKSLHRLQNAHDTSGSRPAGNSTVQVGRCVFTPIVFDCLNTLRAAGKEYIGLRELFSALPEFEEAMTFEIRGHRYDCGSKVDYMKAMTEYGMKHPAIGLELSAYIVALKAKKRVRPATQR